MSAPLPRVPPVVVLRDLREEDAPALAEIESPANVRYMSQQPATEASARAYIETCIGAAGERPRTVYELALTTPASGDRMLGRCGLKLVQDGRAATVWFVVHPAHHGHGLATAALRALADLAFITHGVHRLFAECDPRNLASARVMEHIGMRREAHLVEDCWLKDEWCDTLVYGLLDREWAARR